MNWRPQRISIATTFFVIVPWTIVLAVVVRFALVPDVPPSLAGDVNEIDHLTRALHAYAAKYGAYPPDFTSRDPRKEINEHLRKIFPQRNAQLDTPTFVDELGPDNALEFWLRGLYDNNPQFPLTGRVSAAEHPLTNEQISAKIRESEYIELLISEGATPGKDLEESKVYREMLANYKVLQEQQRKDFASLTERVPLYPFRLKRLSPRGAYHLRCCNAPLVYFRADNYERAQFQANPQWGIARPYRRKLVDGKSEFIAPNQFQVICAGYDEDYGSASIAASDAVRYSGHLDNLTSFSPQPLGIDALIAKRIQAKRIRSRSPLVALFCTIIVYPIVMALRHREDGIVLLERETRRQCLALHRSERWQQQLEQQKQARRERALVRFGATEDTGKSSVSRPPPPLRSVV